MEHDLRCRVPATSACLSLAPLLFFLGGCGGGGSAGPTTTATTTTTTMTASTTCGLSPTEGTWCVASPKATKEQVDQAVQNLCNGSVDCTKCLNLEAKANWTFDTYFHAQIQYGASSCNFNGTGEITWPPYSACRPSAAFSKWCLPLSNASHDEVEHQMNSLCDGGDLDCSKIHTGGECVFPSSLDFPYKSEWVFNAYYQANVESEGEEACPAGVGEIVTAPCGQYNNGNPQTGVGFAYVNTTCLDPSSSRCGCIQKDNSTDFTSCARCATKNPSLKDCEVLCPWIQSTAEIAFVM